MRARADDGHVTTLAPSDRPVPVARSGPQMGERWDSRILFGAIRTHEGPTIVGVGTTLILIFLVLNVFVDLLNALLDPRSRHD